MMMLIITSASTHKITAGINIRVINFEDFALFVQETGYKTNAEKLQSSTCTNINREIWICSESWRDGNVGHPVVHVTPIDAEAFCQWAGVELLTPDDYNKILDERPIWQFAESTTMSDAVNIYGNVWDICKVGKKKYLMIGGSFSCSNNSCRGFKKSDKNFSQPIGALESGNYIGFLVKYK